jgi:EpsI family protein
LSERKEKIDLERQVPAAFGAWRTDRNVAPILPDPSLQAMLDSLYSQVLARSYFNAQGQYVMLSIAYGSDQGPEATAVHRPSSATRPQGFQIQMLEGLRLELAGRRIPLARLAGVMGRRRELISYWVTLDESATLPGLGRKVEQIRYGLRGQIPDGCSCACPA